jgi:hypothetical protein
MREGLGPFDRGCRDHWHDWFGSFLGGSCGVHCGSVIEDTCLVVALVPASMEEGEKARSTVR